ncbi:MAG TPA: amidohydrolase family protein [Stellaceae bacterium]|nr:amidohydrolase family protein [Stellaceae bacterium]
MRTYVRCGSLFTGVEDAPRHEASLVFDEGGVLAYVGPSAAAPGAAPGDRVLDYGKFFVMPGLIDVHVHLAYGNAKSEEDIDLYQPMEFRALRALFFAQQVVAAGFTSIGAPGDAGRISLSVRNAIAAGLFDGPRITAAGRYVSARQSLTDWYPTWIGVPETSIGRLVTNRDEAIEEIRCQVKDGVDCVKIALDGVQRRANGEFVAAFTEGETTLMVEEIHRLGKKAVVHARGREATLYAARAGVDLIFHAYYLDDACIEAMLAKGCAIGPTLTFARNIVDFTQPHDPAHQKGRIPEVEREFATACVNLRKAKAAGVPMMIGTDSGFAITPYGEWHARELQIFVEHLGFTPAEALRAATEVSARFMAEDGKTGTLAPGRLADFIAVEGSPIDNIAILQDKRRIRHVHIGGKEIAIPARQYDSFKVTDIAWTNWSDLYTQERVAALRREQRGPLAAQ